MRVAAPEPRAERRARAVVVDHEGGAAAAYDPVELGEPGLAAGAEEVGPAGVHDVDRVVGERHAPARCRGARVTFVSARVRRRGEGDQVGVRLDADHRRGRRREPRQVEAGAAAEVEHGRARPRARSRAIAASIRPSRVGGAVLDLVGRGVVPDVGAGDRARQVAAQASSRSDADEAVRGLHLRGDDARGAVGGDPLDLDVLERRLDRLAEPLADPLRVAGDLEARQREGAVGAGATGAAARRDVPLR